MFSSIFLIGPMGSGKTTLGRELSTALGLEFVDTDELLVGSLQQHGEAFFRRAEAGLVAGLKLLLPQVIATGGGTILDPMTRKILKQRGLVCYLQVSVEQQLQRLDQAINLHRPLLPSSTPERQLYLARMHLERTSLYESIADFSLNTDNQTIDSLVLKLTALMQEHACL